ncbi:MAG: META domain-containing protein [Desulfobacterales bacterium]|nr:META domain-containing protein [Desulfobacterales bacterium]
MDLRKITKSIILFFFLVLILGCAATDTEKKETKIRITEENIEKICGVQWIVKEMTTDGVTAELTSEPPFVQFETSGKLAGFASVNRFFGSFRIDDTGRIELSPTGATMMAGPEDQMAQEMAFLKTFQKVEGFYLDGIFLRGKFKDNECRLVFYLPVH